MIKLKVTGDTEVAKALRSLTNAVHRKHAVRAVATAAYPTVQAMKGILGAKVSDAATGLLQASLGVSLGQGRRGKTTFARIGSRFNFSRVVDGKVQRPARYVHLVENGHARQGAEGGVVHVSPKPFIRPAWERTKHRVLAKLSDLLGQAIDVETERINKRYARKAARAAGVAR